MEKGREKKNGIGLLRGRIEHGTRCENVVVISYETELRQTCYSSIVSRAKKEANEMEQ